MVVFNKMKKGEKNGAIALEVFILVLHTESQNSFNIGIPVPLTRYRCFLFPLCLICTLAQIFLGFQFVELYPSLDIFFFDHVLFYPSPDIFCFH